MRNLLFNIILFIAGTVFALLLLEVSISLFSPQYLLTSVPSPFFIRYDRELGWANREGAEGVYQLAPDTPPVFIRINKSGMRGRDVSVGKPAGLKRVIVSGDSNAFGYGINEEERFSDLFLKGLPERYEVLNLGVYGYGTDQEMLLLEREGLRYSPDIILLAFSAGDLSDNMNSINSGSSKPYFKLAGGRLVLKNSPVPERTVFRRNESRGSVVKDLLYNHSHFYRLVFNRLAASNIFMPSSVREMTEEEGMRTTVAIIKRLNGLCIESGCRLIVLFISHEQLVAAYAGMKRDVGYLPALEMLLAEAGIQYIDATPALADQYERGEKVFLKNDPVHLSPRGNEIVAGLLYQGLVKRGLIP